LTGRDAVLHVAGMAKRAQTLTPGIELKATLRFSDPPIWRVLRVPVRLTLAQLHRALQELFGWEDCHLHEFVIGKVRFGPPGGGEWGGPKKIDERRVRLEELELRKGAKLEYHYDFGDSWEVELKVTKPVEALSAAECVEGERAGPPEDCGGIPGYEALVAAAADPGNPEAADLLEWIGPDWKPEAFDRQQVNRALRRIR